MISITFGILFFAALLLGGFPIVSSVLVAALAPALIFPDCPYAITEVSHWITKGTVNGTGVTILLFILSGNIMSGGKLTEKIFDMFAYFLGRRRGFMPIICILTAMFYGAISGSGVATTAAIGGMCYPILVELGYEKKFSATILTMAGCLGMVIPPSAPLMIYVGLVQNIGLEISLNSLYQISALSGCICGGFLIVYSYLYCKRHGNGDEEAIQKHNAELRARKFQDVLKDGIWAILTPVIILGGIFSGLMDTMEAGAISLIYAIFVSVFVYKTMDRKSLKENIKASVGNAVPLCVMIAVGNCLASAISALNIPTDVATALSQAGFTVTAMIICFLLIELILGMFMDSGGAANIIIPLSVPILLTMGGNITAYFSGLVLVAALGLTTPPFGYGLFTMASLSEQPLGDLSKRIYPLVGVFTIIAFAFSLVPFLTSWAM